MEYVLIIVSVVLLFVIWNLLRKIEKITDESEQMYDFITEIYSDLHNTFTELKQADAKGGFEADDEIGSIFKMIKASISKLEDKYGPVNNE